MPEIRFKNVSVIYSNKKKEVVAISNLTTTFKNDQTSVILGFSGSGKSSLLKTLFDSANYEGDIFLDDKPILSKSVMERNIGYVSQNYALYPHMTIFDNIAFPLKNMFVGREEIIQRVNDVAKELHIEQCLSRKPKQISGGQQQRVALARALVKNPSICLFDEPLSNLDSSTSQTCLEYIKKAIQTRHMTTLYVTHDVNEATLLGQRIYFLQEGQLIFEGSVEEFLSSEDARIKLLIDGI